MKFLRVFLLVLGAGLIGALSMSGGRVQAATTTVELRMVGSAEVPPSTSEPYISAFARLTYNDATRELTYAMTVSGVSPDQITAAHIHRGARTASGPIIYPLSTTGFTQISGKLTIEPGDVADLMAGNLYLNVHSKTNPAGVARAQIVGLVPAAPVAPAATTVPVSPPSAGDAGLAASTSVMAVAPFLAFLALSGAGVLVLARKRA